jgi:hypothetical protein
MAHFDRLRLTHLDLLSLQREGDPSVERRARLAKIVGGVLVACLAIVSTATMRVALASVSSDAPQATPVQAVTAAPAPRDTTDISTLAAETRAATEQAVRGQVEHAAVVIAAQPKAKKRR